MDDWLIAYLAIATMSHLIEKQKYRCYRSRARRSDDIMGDCRHDVAEPAYASIASFLMHGMMAVEVSVAFFLRRLRKWHYFHCQTLASDEARQSDVSAVKRDNFNRDA